MLIIAYSHFSTIMREVRGIWFLTPTVMVPQACLPCLRQFSTLSAKMSERKLVFLAYFWRTTVALVPLLSICMNKLIKYHGIEETIIVMSIVPSLNAKDSPRRGLHLRLSWLRVLASHIIYSFEFPFLPNLKNDILFLSIGQVIVNLKILSQPKNYHNPKNKITKTVFGLRQNCCDIKATQSCILEFFRK